MFRTPLTEQQKATIAKRYKECREAGLNAFQTELKLMDELQVGRTSIINYRDFDILEASDSRIGQEIESFVKGTSTLYDENGKVKLRWVKTDQKFDAEQARDWIAALAEKVPRARPVKSPVKLDDDTITVIPMGDPHIGMYAWADEAGDDFDLNIATSSLCGAVESLVKCTPRSRECLIANLGDFFHADNMQGETLRSRHKLDTDTRWAKVLVAGLKAMRQCIASALLHHEQVTVINAIGNHDDHSSMFLTVALSHIYENEPRINIIDNPTVCHYYRFHKNLFGVHHGDKIKPDKLPLIMATDRPQQWAECPNRYWFLGHIHHDVLREYQGVKVESFRTTAARDAWATSMGYRAGRDMKAIVYHKDFGEIERHVRSVEMLAATV